MKKIVILMTALAVMLAFASCAGKNGDPFHVFKQDFCAEMKVASEGTECAVSYDRACGSIEFLSPDELVGYKLRLEGGVPYLSFGNTEIAVSEHAGRLAYICDGVFSSSFEDVAEITSERVGDKNVTVVKTDSYTYTFLSDGAPASVSGYFNGISFEITFLSFAGAMK